MNNLLRTITKETDEQVRMMELVEGDRFHMIEVDGHDLGWWTATGTPYLDDNGLATINARPDVEPEHMLS